MTTHLAPGHPSPIVPVREPSISRRSAIAAIGVASATALSAAAQNTRRDPAARRDPADPRAAGLSGWDAGANQYTLPDLPYPYDALEPHIDEQTMRIHHDKHHAGYVKGANEALAKLAELRSASPDASMVEYWTNELAFNVGGHINHTLFWTSMAPPDRGGGARPPASLDRALSDAFGSFDAFKSQFTAAAKSVEGSGWAWLVIDPVSRRPLIVQMHNQQKSVFIGAIPVLGVDVWEHAYYLKYQNRRADYIDAWWNVVNWGEVERRFQGAMA